MGRLSTEAVKMAFDEHVVAVLGSVDGASTHIMLRVALKLEFPIMDTGTTDPTVTETRIPWLIHNFPDDRQQGYTLADYVFKQLKLKKIGVIRTQSRYARIGVEKFFDEAKRMGRVPALEVKFERGDQDFSTQLRMLQNAHVEGVVIWGEAPDAARILKQMREMGMKQPVFGSSRMAYPALLEIAGSAAEGVVTTAPLDPTRTDAQWQDFRKKYHAKFNEEPDAYAAYAYDGMNILIGAIEKSGLNRGKIMDGLREYYGKPYDGVGGTRRIRLHVEQHRALALAKVEGGKFVYLPAQRRESSAAHRGGWSTLMAAAESSGRCSLKRSFCARHTDCPLRVARRFAAIEHHCFHQFLSAQDETIPQTPYATLDRSAVAYRGPGRENAANLPGATVKIGLCFRFWVQVRRKASPCWSRELGDGGGRSCGAAFRRTLPGARGAQPGGTMGPGQQRNGSFDLRRTGCGADYLFGRQYRASGRADRQQDRHSDCDAGQRRDDHANQHSMDFSPGAQR